MSREPGTCHTDKSVGKDTDGEMRVKTNASTLESLSWGKINTKPGIFSVEQGQSELHLSMVQVERIQDFFLTLNFAPCSSPPRCICQ